MNGFEYDTEAHRGFSPFITLANYIKVKAFKLFWNKLGLEFGLFKLFQSVLNELEKIFSRVEWRRFNGRLIGVRSRNGNREQTGRDQNEQRGKALHRS